MAHAHLDDQPFPFGPLLGAGVLVGVSLAAVTFARLGWLPSPETRAPVVVSTEAAATRDLRFADREDGAVVITNAQGAQTVIAPETGGFVRGVVRGLARDRKARGLGPEQPFRLTRWSDGRITLADPATGRTLDLGGFGPTNKQAFLDLIAATGSTPAKES